jgi:sortase (surface protein transpeptidase)
VRAFIVAVVVALVWVGPVTAFGGSVVVESLGISAPVVPARTDTLPGGVSTLTVPCWEAVSAWEAGRNTVLFGHSYHPTCGGVFDGLHQTSIGQEILVDGRRWVVDEVVPGVKPTDVHWLSPTPAPQLTLITCWPPHSSVARLVIVARLTTVSRARMAHIFS